MLFSQHSSAVYTTRQVVLAERAGRASWRGPPWRGPIASKGHVRLRRLAAATTGSHNPHHWIPPSGLKRVVHRVGVIGLGFGSTDVTSGSHQLARRVVAPHEALLGRLKTWPTQSVHLVRRPHEPATEAGVDEAGLEEGEEPLLGAHPRGWQLDDGCGVVEGAGADRGGVRQRDASVGEEAAEEGLFADRGEGVGEDDSEEGGAAGEGAVPDRDEAGWEIDGGEGGAASEGLR